MRCTLVLEFESDAGGPPRRVEALRLHRDTNTPSKGMSLTRNHGCESILLAGTDLALVFGKASSQASMSWHARKRMPRRLHWWP